MYNNDSILDFYVSSAEGTSDSSLEVSLLDSLVCKGIVPLSLSYFANDTSVRGAVTDSLSGKKYLVHYGDNVLKSVTEVNTSSRFYDYEKVLFKSTNSCSLKKGDPPAGGGGAQIPGVPMAIEEEDDVAAQNDLITDQHPGSATSYSPDRPEVGRVWHAEKSNQVDNLCKSLSGSTYKIKQYLRDNKSGVSDVEMEFLVGVLGKTKQEASRRPKLRPNEKVVFQKWLSNRTAKGASNLKKFLEDLKK